ncbi:Hydrogenosomal membrane protein 31-like [Carpediemonas membranifera]|uniref:Hydrogenosomal membrane protein 31-like n=1 Tax=Carpediemonas membranifera TaxID=201153 RepID=A0A8J6AQH5_9EUKA|nr:Hydrogenosomal membrane protein 31-like [Carpediemonas membranifera]|eukprot:KAG9391426.1 Hydrogenosomal membrane protein 31-like [Carpediemonas membranifera]
MAKSKGSLTTFQYLLAGGIAGAVSRTITSPLDVVKILFQTGSQYDSMSVAIRSIMAKEGVAGLWKGNGIALLRIAPYSAVKFTAFERYSPYFQDANGRLTPGRKLVCGALAGMSAVAATYPLDVVKMRLTVQSAENPVYHGVLHAFYKIGKDEGLKGFFAGLTNTLIGTIPYEGGQFMAYNMIQDYWNDKVGRPMKVYEQLLAGCAAGAFAQTISYPFDTVRKMQAIYPQKYHGVLQSFAVIMKESGPTGFYKGTTVNLIKVLPFAALSFATFEQTKRALELYNKNQKAKLIQKVEAKVTEAKKAVKK